MTSRVIGMAISAVRVTFQGFTVIDVSDARPVPRLVPRDKMRCRTGRGAAGQSHLL